VLRNHTEMRDKKQEADQHTRYCPTAVGEGRGRRRDTAGRPAHDVRTPHACNTCGRSAPSDAAACCRDAEAKHWPDCTGPPRTAPLHRLLHTIAVQPPVYSQAQSTDILSCEHIKRQLWQLEDMWPQWLTCYGHVKDNWTSYNNNPSTGPLSRSTWVSRYQNWLRFYIPFNTMIGHFGDVLPGQSLSVVPKKLKLTQQKYTHK